MEQNKDEIPHIIHCCWLGSKHNLDNAYKISRKSWDKHAREWEVREWGPEEILALAKDEVIFPFTNRGKLPSFVKTAMKKQKWAFAADWVRFAALYKYGGVYFDYDFQLLKPIEALVANGECTNTFLLQDGMIGPEGAVLVMKPGNLVAKAMLEYYQTAKFDGETTVGVILMAQLKRTGRPLMALGLEFIPPLDAYGSRACPKTNETIGIHHCVMSWASPKRKIARWLSWHKMRWVVDIWVNARKAKWMIKRILTLIRNWHTVKTAFSTLSFIYSGDSNALDALGGLTEPETEGLSKWLPDEGVFVEVGTLFGLTAVAVKRKHPNLRVIAVDNFSWNPFGLPSDIHAWFTRQILERSGVELVRCTSTEWRDQCLEDGTKIDAIFFDASHAYDDVKDECVWAKEKGIPLITGHDYNSTNPRFGVTRAVNEVFGAENVETAGMCWRVK